LGFTDRPGTTGQAAELVGFFRDNADPRYQVTLLGGVPAGWRTLTRDSQRDPRWAAVYRSFDAISPWSVGRFRDDEGMRRFYAEQVAGDLEETRSLGMGYMPVVFPGFSWHHMNPDTRLNQIPRRGGRFLWSQVEQALAAGSTMLYGAMFDEVDEGTAMFKVAADQRAAPADVPTVTLDIDGVPVPNDWYLRLAREAQLKLRRRRPARAGRGIDGGQWPRPADADGERPAPARHVEPIPARRKGRHLDRGVRLAHHAAGQGQQRQRVT
jgi:hypothetical protein